MQILSILTTTLHTLHRPAAASVQRCPLLAAMGQQEVLTCVCACVCVRCLVPAGAMYPTSMRINEEGRLVVNFKTEARFRGQFVMSHPGTETLAGYRPILWSVVCDQVTL